MALNVAGTTAADRRRQEEIVQAQTLAAVAAKPPAAKLPKEETRPVKPVEFLTKSETKLVLDKFQPMPPLLTKALQGVRVVRHGLEEINRLTVSPEKQGLPAVSVKAAEGAGTPVSTEKNQVRPPTPAAQAPVRNERPETEPGMMARFLSKTESNQQVPASNFGQTPSASSATIQETKPATVPREEGLKTVQPQMEPEDRGSIPAVRGSVDISGPGRTFSHEPLEGQGSGISRPPVEKRPEIAALTHETKEQRPNSANDLRPKQSEVNAPLEGKKPVAFRPLIETRPFIEKSESAPSIEKAQEQQPVLQPKQMEASAPLERQRPGLSRPSFENRVATETPAVAPSTGNFREQKPFPGPVSQPGQPVTPAPIETQKPGMPRSPIETRPMNGASATASPAEKVPEQKFFSQPGSSPKPLAANTPVEAQQTGKLRPSVETRPVLGASVAVPPAEEQKTIQEPIPQTGKVLPQIPVEERRHPAITQPLEKPLVTATPLAAAPVTQHQMPVVVSSPPERPGMTVTPAAVPPPVQTQRQGALQETVPQTQRSLPRMNPSERQIPSTVSRPTEEAPLITTPPPTMPETGQEESAPLLLPKTQKPEPLPTAPAETQRQTVLPQPIENQAVNMTPNFAAAAPRLQEPTPRQPVPINEPVLSTVTVEIPKTGEVSRPVEKPLLEAAPTTAPPVATLVQKQVIQEEIIPPPDVMVVVPTVPMTRSSETGDASLAQSKILNGLPMVIPVSRPTTSSSWDQNRDNIVRVLLDQLRQGGAAGMIAEARRAVQTLQVHPLTQPLAADQAQANQFFTPLTGANNNRLETLTGLNVLAIETVARTAPSGDNMARVRAGEEMNPPVMKPEKTIGPFGIPPANRDNTPPLANMRPPERPLPTNVRSRLVFVGTVNLLDMVL